MNEPSVVWLVHKNPSDICSFSSVASRVATCKISFTVFLICVFVSILGYPVASLAQGVCDRTSQIRDEIVEATEHNDCALVTSADLDSIRSLDLSGEGIRELRAGDFDGLSSLRYLYLQNNQLTILPPGVFSGLANLGAGAINAASLDLRGNPLTTLPTGAFDGLGQVGRMDWNPEDLETLSPGTF